MGEARPADEQECVGHGCLLQPGLRRTWRGAVSRPGTPRAPQSTSFQTPGLPGVPVLQLPLSPPGENGTGLGRGWPPLGPRPEIGWSRCGWGWRWTVHSLCPLCPAGSRSLQRQAQARGPGSSPGLAPQAISGPWASEGLGFPQVPQGFSGCLPWAGELGAPEVVGGLGSPCWPTHLTPCSPSAAPGS